ncbi:MAG: MFS transporter [Anaerolineae bacterium]|nr:MFS transporter [Anaerolineae bacterium]MDW8101322.1 MFS transporter [Anaerolineae bacterium]
MSPCLKTAELRLPPTFVSLRYHNYRLWFIGQGFSLMGMWMQSVAQGWVVYELTGSRFALGLVSFMGTIPTIFLTLPAGVIADRTPKRHLLLATQVALMLFAFTLTGLAAAGALQIWHIALVAFLSGIVNSFDAPARQALAVELIENREDLMNAIALNSTMFNLARVIGPAIGGIVLANLGPAWCFGINGLSFLAVISALVLMNFKDISYAPSSEPIFRQLAEGFRYISGNRVTQIIVLIVGVSTLFGFSYSTLMPAYAADVLKVGERGLGFLNAAVGIGALCGSLIVASLGRLPRKGWLLLTGSLLFPSALLVFAFSSNYLLSLVFLVLVGAGFVIQNSTGNTLLQSVVPDNLRGRVMAVFSFMFFGMVPFGSLLAGSIAQSFGPVAGVAFGAGVNLLFSLAILLWVPAIRSV